MTNSTRPCIQNCGKSRVCLKTCECCCAIEVRAVLFKGLLCISVLHHRATPSTAGQSLILKELLNRREKPLNRQLSVSFTAQGDTMPGRSLSHSRRSWRFCWNTSGFIFKSFFRVTVKQTGSVTERGTTVFRVTVGSGTDRRINAHVGWSCSCFTPVS